MNFEELLQKLRIDLAELEALIGQVEVLVEEGLNVRWGLWVTIGVGRVKIGFHVYSTSKFALLEENDHAMRLLVDSTIVDVPKNKRVEIEIMPVDELPPLPDGEEDEEEEDDSGNNGNGNGKGNGNGRPF